MTKLEKLKIAINKLEKPIAKTRLLYMLDAARLDAMKAYTVGALEFISAQPNDELTLLSILELLN